MKKDVYITKAGGKRELFDSSKLENSLRRVGASEETVKEVTNHILRELEDGMSTSMIYDHAFFLLDKIEKPVAGRYSLRKALGELGPSGFPFEKFIAEIFKARGYEVLTDQFVQGRCAEHEIDLIAWNENRLIMAEAKFHHEIGLKSDLKVALYIKARFDDLHGLEFNYGKRRTLDQGWLVTNTKFTERAIEYSRCAGVHLVGWNYPREGNLHQLIEDAGLHPLTCLTTLNTSEKKTLLEQGVILCREAADEGRLKSMGFSEDRIGAVTKESKFLCPLPLEGGTDRFPKQGF